MTRESVPCRLALLTYRAGCPFIGESVPRYLAIIAGGGSSLTLQGSKSWRRLISKLQPQANLLTEIHMGSPYILLVEHRRANRWLKMLIHMYLKW